MRAVKTDGAAYALDASASPEVAYSQAQGALHALSTDGPPQDTRFPPACSAGGLSRLVYVSCAPWTPAQK